MTDITSALPEILIILTKSTHNIDSYKDYNKQYVNSTWDTRYTDQDFSQFS